MLNNLFAILAVLAIVPAPEAHVHPIYMYGLDLPTAPSLAAATQAENQTPKKMPVKKVAADLGVKHTGKSAFVADVETAGVLYAYKPHDVHPIASLTKLMTAIVVLDSEIALDGELTLVKEDFDPESRAIVRIGDTITRKDALKALMVGSVNEIANAFSRSSGMTRAEFIQVMNRKAEELNLHSLKFTDPTGLEEGNRGSAADVAALLTIAISHNEIREAMQKDFVIITTKVGRQYTIDTTNLLLSSYLNKEPYKIIGAKTGSLPTSGYNLAQVTQNKEGDEVVVVLLGSNNHFLRYDDVKALTAWAFDAYDW